MRKAAMVALASLALGGAAPPPTPGFLDARGTEIVDRAGRPILLRAVGLGGWMLQEGYMLQLGELGQQHVIHQRLAALVGQPAVDRFATAWLDHQTTRGDLELLHRWGFNAVRLPLHHALFMDPAAPTGTIRWRADGFRRTDQLLQWAAANHIWVILDLHAAPGGQGTDLAIADRDPNTPSLWQSEENQRRTVALWRALARRYAGNPWVGAYDILNEPNWDFDGSGGHGCNDHKNAPIKALYRRITAAIRESDRGHLILIEGNCWGNNYDGIAPDWDPRLVLSFHKYWNRNDPASIAKMVALRSATGRPVWVGETGENSNAWGRDVVRLLEANRVGWAWWPLKKIGHSNPLEIVANPGWTKVVAYLTGKGPRPSPAAARAAMMQLATYDVDVRFNRQHPDVVDALMRQPHDDRALPFRPRRLGPAALTIRAADYDLGAPGIAYVDRVDADYHVATGGERTEWNDGKTYRNDGVDLARDATGQPYVTAFEAGEWLQYSLDAAASGQRALTLTLRAPAPATVTIAANGGAPTVRTVKPGQAWQQVTIPVVLRPGRNRLRVAVSGGQIDLAALTLRRR
ncbi:MULTISPECIES: cellulase family glycosylhydrolase [Sphingomonas]|uniref:cellulase family glycosylhydrolase n=1 Tax=Sphingomonas TaxID=13687 RepID=UPI001965D439|nr:MULTISPECIES: cellulase family glycosylhydrolase [Sphingomonas]